MASTDPLAADYVEADPIDFRPLGRYNARFKPAVYAPETPRPELRANIKPAQDAACTPPARRPPAPWFIVPRPPKRDGKRADPAALRKARAR